MLITLLDNILPGTRSVRPPVISGILWVIFLWILLSDLVPLPGEAESGFAAQAYAFASAAGPIFSVFIVSVLIFAVGALMSTATEAAARFVGNVVGRLRRRLGWQRQALRKRKSLRAIVKEAEQAVADARAELDALAQQSKNSKEAQQGEDEEAEKKAKARLAEAGRVLKQRKHKLGPLEKHRFRLSIFRWDALKWIRPVHENPTTRREVQDPTQESELGFELSIIHARRLQAIDSAIQESNIDDPAPADEIVGDASASGRPYKDRDRIYAAQLAEELRADPLDVLRVLNEKHFLSLDQKRAERELRLAISAPTIALGLLASVFMDGPWGLVVAGIGVVVFLLYALQVSNEGTRVLHLISTANLETAAMRRASIAGRDDWRQYVAGRMEKERAEKEARDLEQVVQDQSSSDSAE